MDEEDRRMGEQELAIWIRAPFGSYTNGIAGAGRVGTKKNACPVGGSGEWSEGSGNVAVVCSSGEARSRDSVGCWASSGLRVEVGRNSRRPWRREGERQTLRWPLGGAAGGDCSVVR
jgi:hypothetical protein